MKIVFLEPLGISAELLSKTIDSYGLEDHEIIYYKNRVEDISELIERSKDADVIVLSNIKYPADVMKHCPHLKMICVAFTGIDHIDMNYCNSHNISVCNCSGYSTVAVADIVFALTINLARNIIPCDEKCRQGGTKDGLVGFELEGKTFGIIGLGSIGQRVAKIANAFGCNVIAYNRSYKDIENVKMVSMEELLKTSDIVSLHVPQTDETIGLIGEAELGLMKASAFLINTARGPIVDTKALVNALQTGKIAGAGIDVFDVEPPLPLDNPLINAPNTVVTPHIAFASHQAFEKRAHIVGENIAKWIDGKPQNLVN